MKMALRCRLFRLYRVPFTSRLRVAVNRFTDSPDSIGFHVAYHPFACRPLPVLLKVTKGWPSNTIIGSRTFFG